MKKKAYRPFFGGSCNHKHNNIFWPNQKTYTNEYYVAEVPNILKNIVCSSLIVCICSLQTFLKAH